MKTSFNVPQKLLKIPPVLFVACGAYHTLIITSDLNLWSCGNNGFGQLCLGNKKAHLKPKKTSFSNIPTISSGNFHYFRMKLEKYMHVDLIVMENVDWVVLNLLKSNQVSFSMYLQTLFNLFVGLTKVYFLM